MIDEELYQVPWSIMRKKIEREDNERWRPNRKERGSKETKHRGHHVPRRVDDAVTGVARDLC